MNSDESQTGENGEQHIAAARLAQALTDLRRGVPVVLRQPRGSGTGYTLMVATEAVREPLFSILRDNCPEGMALIITARRAAFLHIPVSGAATVALEVAHWLDAASLCAVADPARDIAQPLKGPFKPRTGVGERMRADAVNLCRMAELLPSAVIATVPAPAAERVAMALGMPALTTVEAGDLDALGRDVSALLDEVAAAALPIAGAPDTRIVAFRPRHGGPEHLALLVGAPSTDDAVLTRLHSACFTGDLLRSLKCDCGDQLRGALDAITEAGSGVLLYLAQEGRGIGLINKLRAYELQDQGFDTIDANERLGFAADERLFAPAAQILKHLGFRRICLLTNNPDKVAALEEHDIKVVERVSHAFPSNEHNADYLATKAKRSGHYL